VNLLADLTDSIALLIAPHLYTSMVSILQQITAMIALHDQNSEKI